MSTRDLCYQSHIFSRIGEYQIRMFHRNAAPIAMLAAIMFFASACTPASSTQVLPEDTEPPELATVAPDTEAAQPLLKTEMGDFAIASARLVDEANGVTPQAGEKLLLVILTQPELTNLNPVDFSLEDFSNMTHASGTEIYIEGDDASRTISTMGGWVGDEFAMGFRVPADINTYTLYWTGNSPIPLQVEE
jgi:hypothetical protein